MARVLQLAKRIVVRPILECPSAFAIRTFGGDGDIDGWLKLHREAIDRNRDDERPRARPWAVDDFRREFLEKAWWSPRRMWLAESVREMTGESRSGCATCQIAFESPPEVGGLAGTVTLAMRGRGKSALPVVHWLLVSPRWRRRGLGTALMRQLELECWELGYQDLFLETLSSWTEATRFYEALGFRGACFVKRYRHPR